MALIFYTPEEATEEQLDETEEVVLVILEAALLSESLPENENLTFHHSNSKNLTQILQKCTKNPSKNLLNPFWKFQAGACLNYPGSLCQNPENIVLKIAQKTSLNILGPGPYLNNQEYPGCLRIFQMINNNSNLFNLY